MSEYLEYKNILWKYYQGALIPENPPHVQVNLTKQEQKELLWKSGAWFLRWPSDWDMKKKSEWWYVIKDGFGGMEELSRNTRSKVRRAMKRHDVRQATPGEIADTGYKVYREAFKKYNTHLKCMSESEFKDYVMNLHPEYWEFFAVWNKENGELTAYSQNLVMDEAAEYKIIKLHPAYLKDYPSYALVYRMNEHYLSERQLQYVNDGARSIAHQTNIQHFLMEKFGFRKAYCRMNLGYRDSVRLIVKLFMPFRALIKRVDLPLFRKLSILLKQEKLYRQNPNQQKL